VIREKTHTAKLVLEDGTVFRGVRFGADTPVYGEVVFNTGMTGYVETFTDCSYTGQILVTTYPLIGNYGVPPRGEMPLTGNWESDGVKILGLVVSEASEGYSHHTARQNLDSWLREAGVPGLEGVDTRALTRKLREHGVMQGMIVPDDHPDTLQPPTIAPDNNVPSVSCTEPVTYQAGDQSVLLVDCGVKLNIIRHLLKRGITVHRVPWNTNLLTVEKDYDGIVLSNGPGDPKAVMPLVKQVRAMLSQNKPMFGICLGNQMLALAAGADTYKLKYGHRSQNQPCQDLFTRRCVITSQNHGYAVREESIPDDWDTWFVNINDGTNEGIRHRQKPFFAVQFHPEAAPGPVDTEFLFDDFARILAQHR
jgi:carbamoyl-phosphate synthase small subunit